MRIVKFKEWVLHTLRSSAALLISGATKAGLSTRAPRLLDSAKLASCTLSTCTRNKFEMMNQTGTKKSTRTANTFIKKVAKFKATSDGIVRAE